MNILIPHHWLLDHLETTASPNQIQEHLSLCGPSVERIEDVNGEPVYDIEITTNRVDAMSVRGIAREAAVILTNAGFPSQLKPLNLPTVAPGKTKLPLPRVSDPDQLCQRVLTVALANVEHPATPEWMAERLLAVGHSAKDVVVDITNYVTHELGHPCHAFDYDRIMQLGGEIRVTMAKPGQEFTTLEGKTHIATGKEVVFVNQANIIIDLPGIIGTSNTVVTPTTKNVLFWIESIAPEHIRTASMTHAIRTTAAQLNERDLDPRTADAVLQRAVELYTQITKAEVASEVHDQWPNPATAPTIEFALNQIPRYLGLELDHGTVRTILTQLECSIEEANDQTWNITPPSFRTDLQISADIVEEIARIYGYHRLPSTLTSSAIPTDRPTDVNFTLEHNTKQLLADLGYQENYTYSMISEALAVATPEGVGEHLRLSNPLTQDAVYLRRHIVPSQWESMRTQLQQSQLRGTFELANVYEPRRGQLPHEHLVLGVIDRDIRSLRRTLDVLTKRLHLDAVTVKMHEENANNSLVGQHFYRSYGIITQGDRVLGTIGYLTDTWVGLELTWSEVLAARHAWPSVTQVASTAAVHLDWTITVPEKSPIGPVIEQLEQSSPLVQSVTLTQQYENNWTFHVVLQDAERQLTQADAQSWQDSIQL